jgi:aryl-alcohol dehydrogenase-like predicted oxidoreductase
MQPNGAAETLRAANQARKVHFFRFTGHHDPAIHLKMLAIGFPFDAVQMPLNAFDATFRSFETQVLPELQRRRIPGLGMKSMYGRGDAIKHGVLTAAETLRYAMSLPVATTIAGVDSLEGLRQNLAVAQNFTPMPASEMQALRDRCRAAAAEGRFELLRCR